MKESLVLLLALFVISTTSFARDEFTITKITPTLESTPEIGGNKRRGGNGNDDKWLAVEVDFRADVDYAEEVTFNYYVLLLQKCYVGETTYSDVYKGRELHSVMYISPKALKKLTGGKGNPLSFLDNITVVISSKGQDVAVRSLKEIRGEWWKQVEGVKGIVLKKSETPFNYADWDYYEQIKAEARN